MHPNSGELIVGSDQGQTCGPQQEREEGRAKGSPQPSGTVPIGMCKHLGSVKCVGIQSWLSKGCCLSSSGSIGQAEGCSSASRLHQHLGNGGNSQVSAAEQLEGGKGSEWTWVRQQFQEDKRDLTLLLWQLFGKGVTLAVLPRECLWLWSQSSRACPAASGAGTVTLSPAQLRLICLKYNARASSGSQKTFPGALQSRVESEEGRKS